MSTPSVRAKNAQQLQKTVMCRFFAAGHCRKGSSCAYAHGVTDIRAKPDLQCTSLCPNYTQQGSCSDPDCKYAHDELELRTTTPFFKSRMCMFAQRGRCKNGVACRFAHTTDEYMLHVQDRVVDQIGMQPPPQVARQLRNAEVQGGTGGWPDSDTSSGFKSVNSTSPYNKRGIRPQVSEASAGSTGTSNLQADSLYPMSTPDGTSDGSSSDGQQRANSSDATGDTGSTQGMSGQVTTVMMANVPPFLTQGSLVSLFEDLSPCMCGTFDFFYCPWDPSKDSNLGYAIINFFSHDCAAQFEGEWSGKFLLAGCRGSKRLRIVPAAFQGRDANIQYFSSFELARNDNPRFRPLIRAGSGEPLRPMAIEPDVLQDDGALNGAHLQQQMRASPANPANFGAPIAHQGFAGRRQPMVSCPQGQQRVSGSYRTEAADTGRAGHMSFPEAAADTGRPGHMNFPEAHAGREFVQMRRQAPVQDTSHLWCASSSRTGVVSSHTQVYSQPGHSSATGAMQPFQSGPQQGRGGFLVTERSPYNASIGAPSEFGGHDLSAPLDGHSNTSTGFVPGRHAWADAQAMATNWAAQDAGYHSEYSD